MKQISICYWVGEWTVEFTTVEERKIIYFNQTICRMLQNMSKKKQRQWSKSRYAIIVIEESMVIKTPQLSLHFYDFDFGFFFNFWFK